MKVSTCSSSLMIYMLPLQCMVSGTCSCYDIMMCIEGYMYIVQSMYQYVAFIYVLSCSVYFSGHLFSPAVVRAGSPSSTKVGRSVLHATVVLIGLCMQCYVYI